MKGERRNEKGHLIEGIIFVLGGIALLIVALTTDSVFESMMFGFCDGAIGAGIGMICRYFYWSAPKNKDRYQEKIENERIEIHDELKIKLRDKSGRYAYILGFIVAWISITIFHILGTMVLGTMEIIADSRTIVLYLGGYMVFQIIAYHIIFHHLLKKY